MGILIVSVLAGNGFDFYEGLDISTRAFIEGFVEKHKGDSSTLAGRLAQKIEADGIETWSDYEMRIGDYGSSIPKEISQEERLKEYLEVKGVLDEGLVAMAHREEKRIDDEFIARNANACVSSLGTWVDNLKLCERDDSSAVIFSKELDERDHTPLRLPENDQGGQDQAARCFGHEERD